MVTFHGTQAKMAVDVDNGVAVADWETTDQVQSLTFDFEGNLTDIYMLGDRDPQEIKEGTIAISGTITRFFGTENFSASATTFCGMATDDPLDEFWVALFPDGTASPKILISNCKFGGWSMSQDINGLLTETASFKGKAIAVS